MTLPPSPNRLDLLADIGGTNTRVALSHGGVLRRESIRRFSNNTFASLEQVLRSYLDQQGGVDCAGAAVALAGPVQDGVGSMTNLDWRIDLDVLTRATGAEQVVIINDLQAQGYALDACDPATLSPILPGRPGPPGATRMVIGIGTGFNAAPVFQQADSVFVPPSEAGHADLPLRSQTELALAAFIARAGHGASIEDLLSGRGLQQACAFFAQGSDRPAGPDAAAVLRAAKAGNDPAATAALRHFITILGRVTGDLALVQLPFGGIFLAGGMARAIAPFLAGFGFAEAFRDKGRFADFMSRFAVTLVQDDFAALHGCARALAQSGAIPAAS